MLPQTKIGDRYKGLPIGTVRRIIRQTLEGLESLHSHCKIIHTDIKPENILLALDFNERRELERKRGEVQSVVAEKRTCTSPSADATPTGSTGKASRLSKTQKRNLRRRQKEKEAKQAARAAEQTESTEDANFDDSAATTSSHTLERDDLSEQSERSTSKPVAIPAEVVHAAEIAPSVKIADLGNSCWVDHHFSADIQTRQYRCIEVILGAECVITTYI